MSSKYFKSFYSSISAAIVHLKNTVVFFLCFIAVEPVTAEIDRFIPFQGGTSEIWQLTNKPAIRQSINYHNTNAWSSDGRYISIEESVPHSYMNAGSRWRSDPLKHEIYIYDLQEQEVIYLGRGIRPRWANRHNWLFYIELPGPDIPLPESQIIWLDVNSGRKTVIGYGLVDLGETDSLDRWLYGSLSFNREIGRIPIPMPGELENISSNGAQGGYMIPNPLYPVIFYSNPERDARGNLKPFGGVTFLSDLSGENVQIASPTLQAVHTAWSGSGEYLLHGGSPIMGRHWDEPFPSNLHVLSHARMVDVYGCGQKGRWVSGSGNVGPLSIADLRSGDGWNYLQNAASYIHDSTSISYGESTQLYDNNAKCSPDGTKVVFESNYDLRHGPVTSVRSGGFTLGGDTINVLSSNGFPAQGKLSVGNEVIGYSGKTATSFYGITRNMHNTTSASLAGLTPELIEAFKVRTSDKDFLHEYKVKKELLEQLRIVTGEIESNLGSALVTSFDMRMVPDNERGIPALRFTDPEFPEKDSPLIWQRQTNVFVAVVRKPDSPFLRQGQDRIELIPGENHAEIRGYYILKDGERINDYLATPNSMIGLPGPGVFSAVAVEWSGLESEPSHLLVLDGEEQLEVLGESPTGFEYTEDRWLVNDAQVSAADAQSAETSIREIVHHYDGTIHRENYHNGIVLQRDDLNLDGKAIRRQYYQGGKLIRREYRDGAGRLRSTEHFDNDGYIIELIRYSKSGDTMSHTLLEGGIPLKHTGTSMLRYGSGTHKKAGDNWVETEAKLK